MLNIFIKTKGKGTCMADISSFYILQNVLLKDWHSLPSGTRDVPASKILPFRHIDFTECR